MGTPAYRRGSLTGSVPPPPRSRYSLQSQPAMGIATAPTLSTNGVRQYPHYQTVRRNPVLPSCTDNGDSHHRYRRYQPSTYHPGYAASLGNGSHHYGNGLYISSNDTLVSSNGTYMSGNSNYNHTNSSSSGSGASTAVACERLPPATMTRGSQRSYAVHGRSHRNAVESVGPQSRQTAMQPLPSPYMTNHSSASTTNTTTNTSLTSPSPLSNALGGRVMPIPLRNFGNTCYLNATMQCAVHTPWFLSSLAKSHVEARRQPGTAALLELGTMNTSNPGQLLLTIKNEAAKRNDEFADNGQSDAHEFLRTFLYIVHGENNRGSGENTPYEELKDIENEDETTAMQRWCDHLLRVDNSVVYDLFGGVMRSKCVCDACGKMSLTFDPFLDLSLPMMSSSSSSAAAATMVSSFSSSSKKPISIESLLGANFNDVKEKLRGGNQLLCTRCKRLRNGTRSVKVTQWPKILVLQLKRFDHTGRKNGATVAYPESFTTCGENAKRYQLYGVVCHHGTESWGHYTSYVCLYNTGEWFLCNDATITPTSVRKAMDALSQAYIIFYAEKT
ncbi:putative ubiquitin hydrolase, putative,cysteine peptidase, Clan CA, family C19 [Trypanosoma theileri]|uniref:Putative ubiquitin hydrolase, putative,cysteine peptidase, Clan CA, family C19 n=1 Tax=Trypanosoma theileri TaxID=67003 RepID=A0A1X0P5T2_9TRYP|nr:putative ubiquitin hydrolase, putative,cysteine peptidase, Clan CA, family C19 [Trypanosoma theileri]ORC92235.1 putative ubiquitin hydrolase, putative,cysteine peptidase, Clan CA, family C19 [Trypanosoma theileri]